MKTPDEIKRERRHNKKSKVRKVNDLHITRKHTPFTAKIENVNIIHVKGTNEIFRTIHTEIKGKE